MDPVASARGWSASLEGQDPDRVVHWAVERFGPSLAIGSSFGRDGLVVLDIARKISPRIPVLFLETGYHFPETLQFRDDLENAWNLNVVNVRSPLTVPEQDARYGRALYARDPDACCQMRKVEPLQKALAQYSAWMTGVRRDQHAGRATTPTVEWQELAPGRGVFKVNPMVAWSRAQVDAYLREHGIPEHPLWSKGYPSVGCAPCTAPVAAGADERSGRWVASGKTECGIHVVGVARSPTHGAP